MKSNDRILKSKIQCLILGSTFYELCDLKQDIWPFSPILLMRLQVQTKSATMRIKYDNVSIWPGHASSILSWQVNYFKKCFHVWHSNKSSMSMLYSQNPLTFKKWVSYLWREILQLYEEPLKGSNFTDLVILVNLFSNLKD